MRSADWFVANKPLTAVRGYNNFGLIGLGALYPISRMPQSDRQFTLSGGLKGVLFFVTGPLPVTPPLKQNFIAPTTGCC